MSATITKKTTIEQYLDEKMSSDKIFQLCAVNGSSSMVKVDQNENPIPGREIRYPNTKTFPSEYIYFDPNLKTTRHCRLVIGQKSIYKEDQPSEKDTMIKVQQIVFEKGRLLVRHEEPTLMQFCLLAPWNASNPFRDPKAAPDFMEFDHQDLVKKFMDFDTIDLDAKHFCYKGDWREVKVVATAFGCNMSEGVNPQEVRMELYSKAKKNPVDFMKKKDDPKNERRYVIMQALNKGVLIKEENKEHETTIRWDDGAVLCVAPPSMDPVSHFVNATYTDKAGETAFGYVADRLRSIESPGEDVSDKYKINLQAYITEHKSAIDTAESILKEGLESKVLDENAHNIYLAGTSRKWKKEGFLNDLKNNPQLKAEIRAAINKVLVPKI